MDCGDVTLDDLSSSPMSETARPSRRFMKMRAMMRMKMRKKILAIKGVSSALMKLVVKSNSPINMASSLGHSSDQRSRETSSHLDEGVLQGSKGQSVVEEDVENKAE